MTADLEEVEKELSQLERALQTPRDWMRGRAGMNSVGDSLRNVGRRLQRSLSASSIDSARELLSRRFETAQLAFSSRTPLNVVQLIQEEQRTSIAAPVVVAPSQRRPSMLLASRRRASQTDGMEYSLEHYETVVAGVTAGCSDPSVSKRKLDVLSEANDDDLTVMSCPPPRMPLASILLNRSQSENLVRVLSDVSVSGSIQPSPPSPTAPEQAESVLYSWGVSGLTSLHDDDLPRTADQSLVQSDSRLGKPGAKAVLSLDTSATHSACTLASGTVLTWGKNEKGVVDPYCKTIQTVPRPTLFEAINNLNLQIVQVSCGYDHTAALSDQGTVLTWGSNEQGQLGHRPKGGAGNDRQTFISPQMLVLLGGQRAASVACGYYFTLVLTTRMCVLACGDETITGCTSSSGGGNAEAATIPALQGLPLVAVAAGHHHAIVLTSNGTAFAWGLNESGCCGRPYPPQLSLPVEVHFAESPPPTPPTCNSNTRNSIFQNWSPAEEGQAPKIPDDFAIVQACAGSNHSCFVTRSGRVLVCGSNCNGQLGLSGHGNISPAEPLFHPESHRGCSFVAAAAGANHTLLLDCEERVWQLGGTGGNDSADRSTGPKCVLTGKNILSIAAGGDHCIAMAAGEGFRRKFSMTEGPGTIVDTSLLANTLEGLMDSIHDEEDPGPVGEEVARGVEELLQNPAVMNSVFFDPGELERMYLQVLSLGNFKTQQVISTAIEMGIAKGLASISPANARMIYPEAVRCLLLYIRFLERPTKKDGVMFDLHGNVISALTEAILGLPFEGYKAFLKWATSLYSKDLFVKMLVKPLLFQLEKSLKVTIDSNQVAHTSLSFGATPMIVSVLQWLYHASDKLNIAKAEDFYSNCFELIPSEALFNDLYQLKLAKKKGNKPANFLISRTPFLFSPKVKQGLLQVESQIEMFKVASANSVAVDVRTGSLLFDPFFKLEVDREHMLEQTLNIIRTTSPSQLRKKLQVSFKGEEGFDAGGVTKEFFQLVSEELFDVSSPLWTGRFGEDVTWFNEDCVWNLEGFELAGMLVGLAIYNTVVLDVNFPMAVYRKLLGYPLGLEDMMDEDLKKGFQQLLDYDGDDVENIFCLNFEVTWTDSLGVERVRELKPGGSEIPVTTENREEYVRLYTSWLLVDSIDQQWEAFERGLTRIIEGLSLDLLFRPEELKLLVVGSPDLDFDALKANTAYEAGYDENSATIKNFWKFIKNADRESQLNFLKFAAGSSMAPVGGLGALKFKIQRAGPDSQQLPTSHTCFNTLLLPDYDSYEKLEDRLSRAIVECEGFGLK